MDAQTLIKQNVEYIQSLLCEYPNNVLDRLVVHVSNDIDSAVTLGTCSELKKLEPGIHIIPIIINSGTNDGFGAREICQHFGFDDITISLGYVNDIIMEQVAREKFGSSHDIDQFPGTEKQLLRITLENSVMRFLSTTFEAYLLPTMGMSEVPDPVLDELKEIFRLNHV